jgi:hypothetical protein
MFLNQDDITMMMLEGSMDPGSFDEPDITLTLIQEQNGEVLWINRLRI